MEEIQSPFDSDEDSDEFSKEREEELYSVLHYNDFSQGVPQELLEKYCISRDEHNEFVISFKNSDERSRLDSDREEGSNPVIKRTDGSSSSNEISSDYDVVIIESDSQFIQRSSADSKSDPTLNRKRASAVNLNVGTEMKLKSKKSDGVLMKSGLGDIRGDSTSTLLPKKRNSGDSGIEGKCAPNPKSLHVALESKLAPNPKRKSSEAGESAPVNKKKKTNDPVSENGNAALCKLTPNPKKKGSEACSGPDSAVSSEDRIANYAVESRMISNPKNTSNLNNTSNSSHAVDSAEVVIEQHSDSDDSSVVVVEDPEANRKISVSSTESVVALLSSEEDGFDFSLNTTDDILYDSDGNVSDVIEKSQFEWEQVASPSTWTREMKKYYNSSCEKLRYFDHKTIRQQIKKGSRKDWMISPRDLYPSNRPKQRCLICRQNDHLARNCPKQDPTCHMCGVQGHSNVDCPNSICLQCGKQKSQFTAICRSCTHTMNRACFNCLQTGHESKACPEKWREFHSTTQGPLKKTKRQHDKKRSTQCCNCGKTNHSFEECNQQYMSNCVKSLPAYNWLFGRSSNNEDWRYSGHSGFSPGNSFKPYKRRRGHYDRDSFDDGIPQWMPVKKVKRKRRR